MRKFLNFEMKSVKSVAVIVLIIGFCLVLLPNTSRAEVGIGGKYIGEVPFLIGSLDFNQFGIEAGRGMRFISIGNELISGRASLTYYLVNGRYYFPTDSQLKPYMGGGVLGVDANYTATIGRYEATFSGSSDGYDIFAGVELPLESYGFPVTVFGGIDYLNFEGITLEYEGLGIVCPVSMGGTTFHIGAKYEF